MKFNVKENSKDLKINKTIVAVAAKKNTEIGVDKKKDLANSTVEFVIKKPYNSSDLFKQIRTYLSAQTGVNLIDVDSFVSAVEASDSSHVVHWVVNAVEYAEVIPFSKKTKKPEKPEFVLKFNPKLDKVVKEAVVVANATTLVRELQDTPSNELYPQTFVERFVKEFKGVKNVKVTVLDKKEIQAKKMGMLLGVNKGSVHECKLLVVHYEADKSSKERFAYVGKGICYDSGGMNLKPGAYMRSMKYDMSGAAVVMGTVLALAKNEVKTNVVAVAALTENLLSNQAQRPDDIVIAYNGKSVEIDNTDAEGRLVLGDAISYAAKDLKATRIFDVATLTGAMLYALGNTYTGVWATNDKHWQELESAASIAAEAVWRLPLHQDYLEMLNSQVADIANSASRPEAGSSRAAMFLTQFCEGVDLVHLDIAATAESAVKTGEGVILRTLYQQAKGTK